MNTQQSLIAFLSWPAEVRAACVQVLEWPAEVRRVCVAAHAAIESKSAPAQLSLFDTAKPLELEPAPITKPDPIETEVTREPTKPTGKRPRRRRYGPRHHWTADERELLFSEFDAHGIRERKKLRELAKLFSVSVPAIVTQYYKQYKAARATK